jgi:hypothetical protein
MTPLDMTFNLAMYTWRPATIALKSDPVHTEIVEIKAFEPNERASIQEVNRAINTWCYS